MMSRLLSAKRIWPHARDLLCNSPMLCKVLPRTLRLTEHVADGLVVALVADIRGDQELVQTRRLCVNADGLVVQERTTPAVRSEALPSPAKPPPKARDRTRRRRKGRRRRRNAFGESKHSGMCQHAGVAALFRRQPRRNIKEGFCEMEAP